MDDRVYNRVILDSCFVSSLRRIDPDCDLLEWCSFFAQRCAIIHQQFKETPCNHLDPDCDHIEAEISDEDVINFFLSYPGEKSIEHYYATDGTRGDHHDLRMLAFAHTRENCLLLTSDQILLILCNDLLIAHACFKAGFSRLCEFEPLITTSGRYDISEMFGTDGTDPFFTYGHDEHCPVCHPKKECRYRTPRFRPAQQ